MEILADVDVVLDKTAVDEDADDEDEITLNIRSRRYRIF